MQENRDTIDNKIIAETFGPSMCVWPSTATGSSIMVVLTFLPPVSQTVFHKWNVRVPLIQVIACRKLDLNKMKANRKKQTGIL